MLERLSFKKNYGLTIFITAGILVIPQIYYLSNIKEFSYDILLVSLPLIVSFFLFIILGIIFNLGSRIQGMLAGSGLSILMCDFFLRLDIGYLDGSSEEIVIDPVLAILNTALYFGLPLVFFLYANKLKKILIDLSVVFTILLIGITLYTFSYSLHQSIEKNEPEPELVASTLKVSSEKRPNVYFIWLDAMQTDYMKKYILDNSLNDFFSDFTFFENNSANYLYSNHSYVSFMSGTTFKGKNYSDYIEWSSKKNNFRKSLSDAEYKITTYAKKEFTSNLDKKIYSADDIFLEFTSTKHPYISDYITYWSVRTLPSFLANHTIKVGGFVGEKVHKFFNRNSSYSEVKSISDGIEPLTGVFTLKKLISDEKSRKDHNELVIAQAVIPHGPYVIDKNCNYRGPSYDSIDAATGYYNQVQCSAALTIDFLEQLKSLERYNSSLIIIMGDHGSGWAGPLEKTILDDGPLNSQYMPWSKSQVISRASALLMIKPPNTVGKKGMEFSNKPSQLVDIYPTALSMLSMTHNPALALDGIDLSRKNLPNRKQIINYYKPAQIIDPFNTELYELKTSSKIGLNNIAYASNLRDKGEMYLLKCNELVTFSSMNELGVNGLSGIESWGRWSDNQNVSLLFRINSNQCNFGMLKIKLRGFVTPKNKSQYAKVKLNEVTIGEVLIKHGEQNPREFVFNIPEYTIKDNDLNKLEFYIDKPISPKSVGVNEDTRLLGLGFESMVFQ